MAFSFYIAVKTTRQCGPKPSEVCSAIALRDIVGVTKNILLEAVIPLQCNLNANAIITHRFEMKDLVNR